jgi:hypothetical protein
MFRSGFESVGHKGVLVAYFCPDLRLRLFRVHKISPIPK